MPTVKAIEPIFFQKKYHLQGDLLIVTENDLEDLADRVKVVGSRIRPKDVHQIQKNSSDFARFCMAHQNTYPDGHCPIRRDRIDPMSKCMGWRLKTKTNSPKL